MCALLEHRTLNLAFLATPSACCTAWPWLNANFLRPQENADLDVWGASQGVEAKIIQLDTHQPSHHGLPDTCTLPPGGCLNHHPRGSLHLLSGDWPPSHLCTQTLHSSAGIVLLGWLKSLNLWLDACNSTQNIQ